MPVPFSAQVGETVPDLSVPVFDPAQPDRTTEHVSLSDYRGRWLILFFYPMDFTFVCPTEILALADKKARFDELGTEILGCSTDTIYTHRAWTEISREKNGIAGVNYRLGADHTGSLARAFGVLIEEQHVALRGLFIVDPNGVLQYSVIHALNVGRSTDETLRVLEALQTGGLCPSDWTPGKSLLTVRRHAA